MKEITVFRKLIFLAIALLAVACSTNQYMLADKYLEHEQFQDALDEYIRIAKGASSLNLSHDITALTGAMIAYYSLGNYKNSFALSRRILSLESYNSCAIFYAGLNLEKSEKYSLAKKIYNYYQMLSPSDSYYSLILSRFTLMAEKEMEERAKMAIKMEQSVGVGAPIENSIAVLYFLNILENSEWNAISKGLAEMMITDFSQIKSLKVIERIQLQKLMDEMALGLSGLAEAATAPRMGKLMRARNLVNGSFMVKAGKNLTINSDLVDVNGTQQYDGNEFSGKLEEILNLEKKVVFSSLINLGIQVSNTERDNINKNTTKSLQAFLAYCKGLDQYDQKDIAGALISFNQSIKLDPNFQVAQKQANLTQAITIVQQGRFPTMHRTMRTSQFASAGRRKHAPAMGFRQRDPIRLRLQQVSNNLDLGYLPGNSSRNGSSEIINEEILDQLPDWTKRLDLLPEPPKPPSAPPTIR